MVNEKRKMRVKHSWNAICTDGPGHTIAPGGTANGSSRATPCSRVGGPFDPPGGGGREKWARDRQKYGRISSYAARGGGARATTTILARQFSGQVQLRGNGGSEQQQQMAHVEWSPGAIKFLCGRFGVEALSPSREGNDRQTASQW